MYPRFTFFKFMAIVNISFCCYFLAISVGVLKPSVSWKYEDNFQILEVTTKTPEKKDEPPEDSELWKTDTHFVQHGDYWIGYSRVKASKYFTGNESITLTTPSDYPHLDNLVTLVERWRGPISCAVFAPGSDYANVLRTIYYLRQCTSPLIEELVTFHLFFPKEHIPKNLSTLTWEHTESQKINCKKPPPFGSTAKTYRNAKKLIYPINVARNVARENAQTHFVFPCDIELYPSLNVIPEFLSMIADVDTSDTNESFANSTKRKVFVLPVFELHKNATVPNTNSELQYLFEKKLAIPFHKYICDVCHNIPELTRWLNESDVASEGVFTVTKRMGTQTVWEPFYIGTKMEPVFDERVTWEGQSNKRIQAYTLCLLNYDFFILRKAFLVHRPGIKVLTGRNKTTVDKMNEDIYKVIMPELRLIYGSRDGCVV